MYINVYPKQVAEQPQQISKSPTGDQFTFTWTIKNYHEVADLYPTGRWFYSDSFIEPGLSTQKKSLLINNDKSTDYLWRMCMYPNGVSHPDKNYIGLFLKAIPTDHERENNSSVFGRRQFLKLSEIYPDPINKFDLIVRVRITNEESIAMLLALQEIPYGEFPLASQIPKYFDDERFCDVEFSFSCGLTIKAHKIILASQSKYFENMLNGQWIEGRNKVIPIKEIDYEIFKCVMYYLYTGKLEENLQLEQLKEAYMKADMLGLENLTKIIANRIAEDVNHDNWDEILLLGWKMGDTCLKSASMGFVTNRWDELKNTVNMQRVIACNNVDWIEELIAEKIFGVHEYGRNSK
ncbi:2144_t:CDS:2 [Entrophospora sp. SA101]|nr:3677_t:CDS:2 [Entrophospora sp. SA101]CAJ0840056.1 10396_t:CDS:2 [Entrophospora sp. SA101]CAJ0840090.1 10408_t:CDS:2 [Entrophospora sp. SA101]CAJ0901971.1 2144_t:CDS:2 [Entrophospora sp. SA101]